MLCFIALRAANLPLSPPWYSYSYPEDALLSTGTQDLHFKLYSSTSTLLTLHLETKRPQERVSGNGWREGGGWIREDQGQVAYEQTAGDNTHRTRGKGRREEGRWIRRDKGQVHYYACRTKLVLATGGVKLS